jgi:hypothetical protein
LYLGARYVELDIALVNAIRCKNMSRHFPIFTAHSASLWDMMRRIVGLMTSCMKDQGIHIRFKEKHNKREIMCSSSPQVEENSTLVVDSKEEDEKEAWVEVEVRLFVITAHIQNTWQGILRTLVPLVTIGICLIMSLNIFQCCYTNSRRDEDETNKSN